MKVRDIGKKIGDIDIKAPSKKARKKASTLLSSLYRLSIFSLVVLGIVAILFGHEKGQQNGFIIIAISIAIILVVKYIKNSLSRTD